MSLQGAMMSKRISELERDNTRLRGMLDVTTQRVAQLQSRNAARNLEPLAKVGNEQEDENGDDYEGGNGGGNRNGGGNNDGNGNGNDNGNGGGNGYGNHNMNFGGFMPIP
ncbi:hypothetical protein Tco_1013967 [Tanacetum coccineum]